VRIREDWRTWTRPHLRGIWDSGSLHSLSFFRREEEDLKVSMVGTTILVDDGYGSYETNNLLVVGLGPIVGANMLTQFFIVSTGNLVKPQNAIASTMILPHRH